MAKTKPPPGDAGATLTKRDVAALLQVHPRTVLRLAARGAFPPPVRCGRRLLRWRRETVLRWLAEREGGAA